jgi:hypothetical protein
VNVTVYADRLQCRGGKTPLRDETSTQPRENAARGRISRFSWRSRYRLLKRLAEVRNVDGALFITLTYPDLFPEDPEVWKRDLAALRKRLARLCPGAGGIWRMERVRRKSGDSAGKLAPHFHLMVFGVDRRPEVFRRWLRIVWYRIAHRGDVHCGRAAVQCDPVRSRRHAVYYLAKYMAKPDADDAPLFADGEAVYVGRYWGMFGNVDIAVALVCVLSPRQWVRLRRYVVRWLAAQNWGLARRLKRAPPHYGCNVFRLGDLSGAAGDGVGVPTILKMLTCIKEECRV